MASNARKILIVDDNRIILHLLRLTFSDVDKFQVFEADSGEQVLPLVIKERPEIIILDVMLPGDLNGFQICQRIKNNEQTRHCCVVLLSAKTQKHDLEQGKLAGADHYVTKPFSPVELINLIDQIQ